MTTIHNLGFPRIGARRELKFALESYWKGESSLDELKALGADLRQRRQHGGHPGEGVLDELACHDAVAQPVRDVLGTDAARRAVLHEGGARDVGDLRAADTGVDPAHDIPEDALHVVVDLVAAILLVQGLAESAPLLGWGWFFVVLLAFKIKQAPLVGRGPSEQRLVGEQGETTRMPR